MKLSKRFWVILIIVDALVISATGAIAFALHWFTDLANKCVKSEKYDSLNAISTALRLLERGESQAAQKSLEADLISHMNSILYTNRISDYAAYRRESAQTFVVETSALNNVSDYCDRVRLFEQKHFNTNLFNTRPVYEFLQTRKGK